MLQNDKYMAFVADNAVDVIIEERLQEGVDKKDPKAATYEGKDDDGKPATLMKEWPNLTLAEMLALATSPGGQYNHTGKIPYVSLVDPYTLKEVKGIPGGEAGKGLIEDITASKAQLNKDHGPSVKRSTLTAVTAQSKAVEDALAGKGGVAAALPLLAKLQASTAKEGEGVKAKVKPVADKVMEAAKAQLDDAETKIGAGDVKGATTILSQIGSLLKGTELEGRVKELSDKAKAASAK